MELGLGMESNWGEMKELFSPLGPSNLCLRWFTSTRDLQCKKLSKKLCELPYIHFKY